MPRRPYLKPSDLPKFGLKMGDGPFEDRMRIAEGEWGKTLPKTP